MNDKLYNIVKTETLTKLDPTAATDWFSLLVEAYGVDKCAVLVHEFRSGMLQLLQQTVSPATIGELLHKSYLLTAQDSFADYMTAVEWKRNPKAKFWQPRSRVLEGQHGLATKIQTMADDPVARFFGLSLPPGTGKSTMIKFLLSWIYGKFPNSANMYVSYASGMVRMIYDAVCAILTDTMEYDFQTVFPNVPPPTTSADYFTISARSGGDFPTIGLVSLGGSVTGRTRANKFLITDDLVKDSEQARSMARMENLWSDYTATVTTRSIGDDVKQIQLGTVWSLHDPISRNKRRYDGQPGCEFIAIPVKDELTGKSNFYFDHPDRYSDAKIAEIQKSMDPADFECLYMQHGVEKRGMAFAEDTLLYYDGTLPDGAPRVVFAIDVAWGGGDFLSMPIGYVYSFQEGFWDVYIDDVMYTPSSKEITKPRAAGLILRHKASGGRTEANNGGHEFNDDVARILREQHNYACAMESKTAPGRSGKVVRIEQYAADIRRFHFRAKGHRSKEYETFMECLTRFSTTAINPHDDAPDSLAIMAAYLRVPRYAEVETQPRSF